MPVALAPRASAAARRNSTQGKAPQACASCRKQKRRCDKTMPACSLCTRMSRLCDYSEPPPTPSSSSIMELQAKIAQLENRLSLSEHKPATSDCLEVPKFEDSTVYPSPPSRYYSTPLSSSPANPSSRHSSVSPQPAATMGYSHQQHVTSSPFIHHNNGLQHHITPGHCQSDFPVSLFLDTRLFKNIGPCGPRITYDIPPSVLQHLGDQGCMSSMISRYFRTIHNWLPMVCKKYLHGGYWSQEADTAFLLLSMQLITSHANPPDSAHSTSSPRVSMLYSTAKQFAMQLEQTGVLSLKYLQGLVLVALYEYGHGIMPAAWMTTGQCVRYADFLSLPSLEDSEIPLGPIAVWGQGEERQRTWWAVYIVDKLVSISYHNASSTSTRRPLSAEPAPTDTLPCDDISWDSILIRGTAPSNNRTVSSPYSEPQSPFARLCQTAVLTSRFVEHLREAEGRRLGGISYDYAAVQNLTTSAQELCAAMANDFTLEQTGYLGLSTARALNFSTTMALLNYYGLPALESNSQSLMRHPSTTEEASLQTNSLASVKSTARHIYASTADLMSYISLDTELSLAPVLMLDALYRAGAAFTWMQVAETGLTLNQASEQATSRSEPAIASQVGLWEIRGWLGKLNARWRLAGEFIKCLDQKRSIVEDVPVIATATGPPMSHPCLMAGMRMIDVDMSADFTGSL